MTEVPYYGSPPTSSSSSIDYVRDDVNFVKNNATSSRQKPDKIRKRVFPTALSALSGILLGTLSGQASDTGPLITQNIINRSSRVEIPASPYPRDRRAEEMDLKSGTVEVSKTPESVNFSHAIQHAHDTSGLTWDEIAQLVGVSRRTIHNWLHGSKVTASNAKTLARVCSALERESKGDPIATRAHLLAPRLNGMSPYARALARHLDNEKKYIDYFNPSQRVSVRESPEDVHGTLLDIEELG